MFDISIHPTHIRTPTVLTHAQFECAPPFPAGIHAAFPPFFFCKGSIHTHVQFRTKDQYHTHYIHTRTQLPRHFQQQLSRRARQHGAEIRWGKGGSNNSRNSSLQRVLSSLVELHLMVCYLTHLNWSCLMSVLPDAFELVMSNVLRSEVCHIYTTRGKLRSESCHVVTSLVTHVNVSCRTCAEVMTRI